MSKVYYVTIKGKTLESRDLKDLLARAVTVKRNLGAGASMQPVGCRRGPVENLHGVQRVAEAAVVM